ncbi:MAG TPA: hypothetical protein PK156_28965 [Polyangium sp.]|nr:hypothetical protein [Polyangium sp.]
MSNVLESLIRQIRVRIREDDPTVIEDAVKLTEQYPTEAHVWDILAHAYSNEDNVPAAVDAMTRAIELRPGKPALHFERGEYQLRMGNYERAIADFTEGLAVGNDVERKALREVLHFVRAEAFYQLGRKAEALRDLQHVTEDCIFWTVQVRSKAELVALCADAATPDNDGRYQGITNATEAEEQQTFDEWQLPDDPDNDEAKLAHELGPDGLAKADATLIKWVRPRWLKVARVLIDAIEADDFAITNSLVRVYLRRLIGLVDAGSIEGAGNLRRPRFSEVRLPPRASP